MCDFYYLAVGTYLCLDHGVRRGGGMFLELGVERHRVARQNGTDGILPFILVLGGIPACHTSAVRPTVDLNGKALAVQLETFCLLTVTSHGRYFLSMERVDL